MLGDVELSIIIINWNSCAFLEKCLASIYQSTKEVRYEVIVVDNASFDGSLEMVQKQFRDVVFVQSKENLGFGRANNLGYSHSKGQNLLFLNPDTEIIGSAIHVMLSSLQSIDDAGIVGCKLLNSDRSLQTSCIQRFPSISNRLFDSAMLRELFPWLHLWGTQALFEPRSSAAAVEMVSGACLMIRRNVFEQIGQFSNKYFMYAEDLDLCYQVFRAGLKAYYVKDAMVIHHGGKSTDFETTNQFSAVLMSQSILAFLRTTRGNLYAVLYQIATAVTAAVRLTLLAIIFLLTLGQYHRQWLNNSFQKWAKVFRWSIGLEGWARQMTV